MSIRQKRVFVVDSIAYWSYDDSWNYSILTRYISKESFWRGETIGDLCRLWEALDNEKYTYDSTVSFKKIKSKLKSISNNESLRHNEGTLYNKVIDRVLFDDLGNGILKAGELSFSEVIRDYVFNHDIPKFRNDSLKTEIREGWLESSKIDHYYPTRVKRYWELDSLLLGDTITFENKSYAIKEITLPPEELMANYVEYSWDDTDQLQLDTNVFSLIPNRYYDSSQVYCLDVNYRQTFDEFGSNRDYEVESVFLYVPEVLNYKGIDIPVACIKWTDIRKKLLNDKRAETPEGKNYATIIENREGLHRIIKSGNIFYDKR